MSTLKIHYLESKYEFLKLLRQPAYALPTILFPVLFYLFFGIGLGSKNVGGVSMAKYLVATYGAFGVIGAALFAFGVGVAIERGQGWLEVKRTTPMPISAYFVAKIAMATIFGAIIVALLFTVGIFFGNVSMTAGQMFALFGVLVSGAPVFCALGLAVGCFAGPNSAVPIVNLIYLPMAFLSGLWVPIAFLPKSLQSFAHWLPPYHYSQLALQITGGGRGESALYHVTALAVATALFTAIAWYGYRRGETA